MKSLTIAILIFLLCGTFVGFAFFSESPHTRKIAVLFRPDFQGEYSFACRIQAACQNLGWQSDIFKISQFKRLKKHEYDFVINLVPGRYKFRGTKYYLAIFHPIHHYFKLDGSLSNSYRHYNGYLLTYSPKADDKNFSIEKMPHMKWYPTMQAREYREPNPSALFYLACIWGNRFNDAKMQRFLNLLDKEPFTRIYGKDVVKKYCPQSYRCPILFDSDSICETAHQAGVTLVLHSDDHNAHGLPSGRIFEAVAASTVVICDENSFVKEHFKDSVLYINTEGSAESILSQIKEHMNWIQSNKEAALEKARQAYDIYKNHFLLEEQLIRLEAFHEEHKNIFVKWKERTSSSIALLFKKANPLSWITHSLEASPLPDPVPVAVIPNSDKQYSLLNSIDFHPQENIFCVTYTHNNKISFYKIGLDCKLQLIQTLRNPSAKLSEPQHAIFSPNGDKVVVANWTNQTLNIYPRQANQLFSKAPIAIIPPPNNLQSCKPHGIAFSPCGKYLAVAYGAAKYFRTGVALFRSQEKDFKCISILNHNDLHGTPKGIVFSPDGTHLLVSFCEPSSLSIFSICNETINPLPKQTISEANAQLSRPEDVKISPDGSYCAVTNSDKNNIAFYRFDKHSNSIPDINPFYFLQNPESRLVFPHGLAFSIDEKYLAVTQFGHVQITEEGDIFWNPTTPSSEGIINLYLLNH